MIAKRVIVAAALVGLLAVPAALAGPTSSRQTSVQVLDSGVLTQLNAVRRQHGLVPLKSNPVLAAAAFGHTSDMLAKGYFAHESVSGAPFWKRLMAYTSAATSGSWSVGENLLWSSPDIDAAQALRLWMASPEHRKNILTPRWREIGIAAVHADTAPGTFGNGPATVITTDFGARR